MWYLPFINGPRNPTVTYHFSDLQEVYTQNVSSNFYTHPIYQVANVIRGTILQAIKTNECIGYNVKISAQITSHIYAPITVIIKFTACKFHGAPRTLT